MIRMISEKLSQFGLIAEWNFTKAKNIINNNQVKLMYSKFHRRSFYDQTLSTIIQKQHTQQIRRSVKLSES